LAYRYDDKDGIIVSIEILKDVPQNGPVSKKEQIKIYLDYPKKDEAEISDDGKILRKLMMKPKRERLLW